MLDFKLRTILIVDDEWALAEVLSAILRDEGYRTLVAGNGREAEALLKNERVDLVVADFLMPIMDAPALIASGFSSNNSSRSTCEVSRANSGSTARCCNKSSSNASVSNMAQKLH